MKKAKYLFDIHIEGPGIVPGFFWADAFWGVTCKMRRLYLPGTTKSSCILPNLNSKFSIQNNSKLSLRLEKEKCHPAKSDG